MDVGFIGLGHMGQGMARRLIQAGHRLTVYNRTRSKASALKEEGAQVADEPGDACRGDAVITMLADDRAVEDLFESRDLLSAFGPETIHIAMSTISVALSERLAAMHEKAGRVYLAAPVFGRPDAAAAGKLFVMAAGPEAIIARCQPLFDAMGQRTFIVSDRQPQANVVKLAGNFLISSVLESLGEAFALTRKSGIDPHRFLEILTETLFSAPVYKTYGAIIADEKYEPAGFKMSLGLKDIRLALAAADAKTVPMPLASLLRDNYLAGLARGEGDSDWSALARIIARNAGL